MQGVILAAGSGLRMRPMSDDRPKPLIMVGGRPLIEYVASQFPNELSELIMVIGYRGEMIRDFCGRRFLGRPVRYVQQDERRGTYHALVQAKNLFEEGERFFVLYGSTIHAREDFQACLYHPRAALAGDKGEFTGLFLFDRHIFDFPADFMVAKREYVLPSAISKMQHAHPVVVLRPNFCYPVAVPEDVRSLDAALLENTQIQSLIMGRTLWQF